MKSLRTSVLAAVFMAGLASCGGTEESSPGDRHSNSPTAEVTVDASTKKDAQRLIDQAFDSMMEANSGSYTSITDLGASEENGLWLKVSAKYDIEREILTSSQLTTSSRAGLDDPTSDPDSFTMRSIVIGGDAYGNPSAGPLSPCWFHYSGQDLTGVVGVDAPIMPTPVPADMIASARAKGFTSAGGGEVRARVPASHALATMYPKIATLAAKDLPDPTVTAETTITIEDGEFKSASLRGEDVVEALERAGMDFAKSDDSRVVLSEPFLRDATTQLAFSGFGERVVAVRPGKARIIEFAEIQEDGNTTCEAAAG